MRKTTFENYRILGIIVTYYPQKELLLDNIHRILENIDKLLLWENTPNDVKEYRFVEHYKIEYCGDGCNSISHALNYAWKYALDNGYDFLLTMDQDSQWCDFRHYVKRTICNKKAPYGIWGPIINVENGKPEFELRPYVITSGMLVSLDIINKLGGWNERFAIDGVDIEFCCRAHEMNIGVYRVTDCNLVQQYGNPQKVSFMGHIVYLRNDSPKRLYNIFWSYVVLIRRYRNVEGLKNEFYINWIKRIKWIIAFENNKYRKLQAIIKSIIDGFWYDLNSI